MNRARDDSEPIDTSTLPAPFAEWAERWRQMGVDLLLHRVPNEFGLPCFKAVLHEPSSPDVNLAAGYGLHVEREIALARTLCEAAQSRLSFIHGGRDDIAPFYAKLEAGAEAVAAAQSRFLATWRARGDSVAFEATPQPALRHHGTRSMLDDVLRLMHSRGFDTVLRRRFEIEGGVLESHGLFLVKVVVPRCENVSNDTRRMGMRLLTRVVGEHA